MTHAAPSRAAGRRAAIRIAVGCDDPAADLTLATSDSSCWSAMLGSFPLPDDHALDALAAAADGWSDAPPPQVDLAGAPAASLLPLVWLRTIWLGGASRIVLRWMHVRAPGSNPCEQLAARLACSLADEVECADPARAHALWGIDMESRSTPGGEVYDLLLGIVDSWDLRTRNGPVIDPTEWQLRTRSAMRECAEAGLSPVALYGAGTHTRALGPLLQQPPVEVACIVDDDPNRHGTRLWGFPIVARERAIEMGVRAVILSANLFEPKLFANCGPFHDAGIRVFRLYTSE